MSNGRHYHLGIAQSPFRLKDGFGMHSGEIVIVDIIRTCASCNSGMHARCWFKGLKHPHWLDIGWLSAVK